MRSQLISLSLDAGDSKSLTKGKPMRQKQLKRFERSKELDHEENVPQSPAWKQRKKAAEKQPKQLALQVQTLKQIAKPQLFGKAAPKEQTCKEITPRQQQVMVQGKDRTGPHSP